MDIEDHEFASPLLKDYYFTWSKGYEYLRGYEQNGYVWREPELTEKRLQGLIIKECPSKVVFLKEKNSLLGCIQECFDDTWSARSSYLPYNMEWIEVFGFMSEFYTIRYLHQIAFAQFPDCIQDVDEMLPEQDEHLSKRV